MKARFVTSCFHRAVMPWDPKEEITIRIRIKIAPSTSRDDFDQLETIPGIEFADGKLRWRQGFAVVFHHNASRRKVPPQQKVMDCAGDLDWNWFAVGDDDRRVHINDLGRISICRC